MIKRLFVLTNIHIKYLLNRTNLISLFCILIFIMLFILYKARLFTNVNEQILYQEYFQNDYNMMIINVYKILLVLISSYIYSINSKDNYFLICNTNKFMFYFTKVLSNSLLISVLAISCFLASFLVGTCFTRWYYLEYEFFILYIKIFFQSLIIGNISSIINYIIKDNFTFIFIFLSFIILDNTNDNSLIFQVINIFFPYNINIKYYWYQIFILMFLTLIIGYLTFKKQENY